MPLKMKIFLKVENNKTIIKAKYYQNSTHSTVQREKHLKYNEEKRNITHKKRNKQVRRSGSDKDLNSETVSNAILTF